MTFLIRAIYIFAFVVCSSAAVAEEKAPAFEWPDGNRMALSLTFDDGWPSQIDTAIPLLDRYGAKATFYIVSGRIEEQLEGWQRAVRNGHEIGNHTIWHPCTENFEWVKPGNAIENYTTERMKAEINEANRQIHALLGVKPVSFAYPCGEVTVGRGKNSQSYVPIITEMFRSGRNWQSEAVNDPMVMDMSRIQSAKMDNVDFEELLPIIKYAHKNGRWLVLAGHKTGKKNEAITTDTKTLKKLLAYAQNPKNNIWIAPVGDVVEYINGKDRR